MGKDLLFGLDLARNIRAIDPPQDPLPTVPNQKEIAFVWVFFDDRHNSEITFHEGNSCAFRVANKHSLSFGLPEEYLSILAKRFLNALPPHLHFFLCGDVVVTLGLRVVSHFLQIVQFDVLDVIALYFSEHFLIVGLDDHSLTHAHIRHEQRILLNVLYQNELLKIFRCQGEVVRPFEFGVWVLFLQVHVQIGAFALQGLEMPDELDLDWVFEVVVILKLETMVLVEVLHLGGELDVHQLGCHFRMLDRLL